MVTRPRVAIDKRATSKRVRAMTFRPASDPFTASDDHLDNGIDSTRIKVGVMRRMEDALAKGGKSQKSQIKVSFGQRYCTEAYSISGTYRSQQHIFAICLR